MTRDWFFWLQRITILSPSNYGVRKISIFHEEILLQTKIIKEKLFLHFSRNFLLFFQTHFPQSAFKNLNSSSDLSKPCLMRKTSSTKSLLDQSDHFLKETEEKTNSSLRMLFSLFQPIHVGEINNKTDKFSNYCKKCFFSRQSAIWFKHKFRG